MDTHDTQGSTPDGLLQRYVSYRLAKPKVVTNLTTEQTFPIPLRAYRNWFTGLVRVYCYSAYSMDMVQLCVVRYYLPRPTSPYRLGFRQIVLYCLVDNSLTPSTCTQ